MPHEAGPSDTADTSAPARSTNVFGEMMFAQAQGALALFSQMMPAKTPTGEDAHWADAATRMQAMWADFQVEQIAKVSAAPPQFLDPMQWMAASSAAMKQLPLAQPEVQQQLWNDGLALANAVLGQFGIGPQGEATAAGGEPQLPRTDRRFADPSWRKQPFFALVHQLYLMLSEQVMDMAERVDGIDAAKKRQLIFATRTLVDSLSPANFPLTNPVVLEKALETRGESLVKGMEHLLADLRRGQLSHTGADAFRVGENLATTPGKVVYETPLYQLIQYTPTTDTVLETPLLIFPPWINRFYILDLNARKSFVRWAVEQGLSVFMVSWKSADASMADVVWDDYIAAQIDAIDHVRARLDVPAVHTIGYCVAGTTLAGTLAVLARKGEADKVASATFFTAQVDFEDAGDLKNFIDDQQLDALSHLSPEGFLDGRYMAATFNLLRGNDLIWNYVEKNYLQGQEHAAFDLLHWNGDVTNLPARWHREYLRDFYRDNRLVVPDALRAGDVPIDLRRITTPCYIQAGREDHIAPPQSVWKFTRHLAGPWTFLLAGSGHIAGVVNPPGSGKYQYWTNDAKPDSLEEFVAGAQEHPGSWWGHWRSWIEAIEARQVAVRGRRVPGGEGDPAIEDAPGRYVLTR